MIAVDCQTAAMPRSLRSTRARAARAAARAFYERPVTQRGQERHQFDAGVFAAPDVVTALAELFAQKCAFCETPAATPGDLFISHFRPAAGVLEADGQFLPDHYYWLAYTWANLYPVCGSCFSMKGNRFPIAAERAPIGATERALKAERPLLLDPCRDRPEQHFIYEEDGTIVSSTDEGRATIEVLNLNRQDLQGRRREAIAAARAEWTILLEGTRSHTDDVDPADLQRLLDGARPYAGARRQFINEWLSQHKEEIESFLVNAPTGPTSLADVPGVETVTSPEVKQQTVSEFHAYQTQTDDFSLRTGRAKQRLFERMRPIERVVIEHFKVIRSLELVFPEPVSSQPSWMMLLGENATGKSSVLQAIVLALIGERERRRLQRDRQVRLDPSSLVTRGEESGRVQVFLAGRTKPIELIFRRGATAFAGDPVEPQALVFGYGATRLLPRPGATKPTGAEYARVDNLFNPFVPLTDARRWLLGLEPERIDDAGRALKDLLQLREQDRISVEPTTDRVMVEIAGDQTSIGDLSAGFESVLALASDIMEVVLQWWPRVEVAEGIVAIDELCAHLHPRWRMRMVASLRRAFPRVQFLCSTHDPLTLKGLLDGEITVLRRQLVGDREEVVALADLPSVRGLQVDQLLTSEHFGLNSTVDPELDAEFAEYYRLKALPSRSPADEARHAELQRLLAPRQLLGTTPREQLAVEAIDTYVATAATITDRVSRGELKEETKRRVADILAGIRAEGLPR